MLTVNAFQNGHKVSFVHATASREGRPFFGRPERVVRTEEANAAAYIRVDRKKTVKALFLGP